MPSGKCYKSPLARTHSSYALHAHRQGVDHSQTRFCAIEGRGIVKSRPSETSVSVHRFLCGKLANGTVILTIEHPMPFVWSKVEVDRFFCRSLAVMQANALVQKVSSVDSSAGISRHG
jgi:hypothetical protein